MTSFARLTRSTALVSTMLIACSAQAQVTESQGFSISFGDDVIAGAPLPYQPGQAPVDEAFRNLNLNVQFDTLRQDRILNVLTSDMREAYAAGEDVRFRASTNYPVFVERAEIRVFDRTRPGRRTLAVIPVAPNSEAEWRMPADAPRDMGYVLRVYDAAGRFDETHALILRRSDETTASDAAGSAFFPQGEAEDRTARRMIPVRGGMVIVSGTDGVPGDTVLVQGDPVRVDRQGRFVVSRILPVGDNIVTVEAYGRQLIRDVHVPSSDWFRTGLLDITAGVTEGNPYGSGGHYVDGRAAFYASGVTAGGWRVTASADTQEGPIEDMFSRLDDRDPLRILDQLREEDVYPTYGDDSTWYDDTPTSGNLYLRLENDTTRLVFGDFASAVEGPGLLRSSRDLYGLELRWHSPGTTPRGDPRSEATVYAAKPESLPQRDVLRGTGGSLYFLSRREIIGGSARVTVELSDPDTGFVRETRVLTEGQDFEIDRLQGVLILAEPLGSGTADGSVVTGPGSDLILNLVVQYEYLPRNGTEDLSWGGRAEAWVTDNLRVGVTALSDEAGAGRHASVGGDVRLRFGEASFAEVEVAQSEGPGFGRSTSTDGGLTNVSAIGGSASDAGAYEARLFVDMADLGLAADGILEAWAQVREQGFETLTEDTPADQELYGMSLELGLSERLRFGADLETFDRDGGETFAEGELRLSYAIDDRWTVTGAVAHLDRSDPADPARTGERTDAALRISYAADEDLTLFGFVQGTLDVSDGLSRNDRAGLGFDARIGEHLDLRAEASAGDGGLAAEARATWRPTENNELYLGYSLDPTRGLSTDPLSDRGRVVAGAAYRYTDTLSTFAESVYDLPGNQRSLTQVYGVSWTPDPVWALSAGIEVGEIRDAASGDFDRFGMSLGFAWTPDEERTGRARLEYRAEDGNGIQRDRITWGVTAGYSTKVARDWRLLAEVDALLSDSAADRSEDGEYLRASLGYAYRPIANETLNVLFRLSYVHDLPAPDQRGVDGTADGPQQRSTILSFAGNYDLNPQWTATAKLGYRLSEIAPRGSEAFTSDTATLTALRFDWHVNNRWDLMAEGRHLFTEESGTRETGALFGVYRHLNDHVSLGLGYEWGSVSDDLAIIDYEGQGVFVNLVGRF